MIAKMSGIATVVIAVIGLVLAAGDPTGGRARLDWHET